VSLKKDFECGLVRLKDARAFIAAHHYAGGSSCFTALTVGLFRKSDGDLLGVAHWLPPARGVCVHFDQPAGGMLALSRLAIHPDVPKNGASYLIGWCIRHIKRNKPAIKMLVTYADQGQGHTGQIYRATNWTYDGLTKPAWRWVRDGVMRSSLAHSVAEMKRRGFRKVGPFRKHRFYMEVR